MLFFFNIIHHFYGPTKHQCGERVGTFILNVPFIKYDSSTSSGIGCDILQFEAFFCAMEINMVMFSIVAIALCNNVRFVQM